MKIDVRFRALDPSEALRAHAVRRIHFQLDRFGQEITAVRVRLSDVNGPRGGVDKQCQITVRGRRLATVVIEELSGDAYSAIDAAVERCAQVIGRELDRLRAAWSPAVGASFAPRAS